MNRYFISLLLLLSVVQWSNAQSALTLSLRQAQQLGLQNRYDVKANQYAVSIAEQEIERKKHAYLPDLQATGRISYFPQLQATLIPPGFLGSTEPAVVTFGAKSISIFSLELHQVLYNPTIRTDIKAATNAQALEQERTRERDIEVKKQISQAYLNVGLRRLQGQIAQREEQRFGNYFTLAEGRYRNGALIENDYLRAKLDLENARQQAITSQQEYELSLATLRYQLNVAPTQALILTDSLGLLSVPAPLTADTTGLVNRTEIRQLALEKQANSIQELRQRQAVKPTLSLVGNYSQQYLNTKFNYNYTDGRWWSAYNYVGLQFTLPITGQFTNKTNLQQAQLRSAQTMQRQQQLRTKVAYEMDYALAQSNQAVQNLKRTRDNYDLAQRIYASQKQQLELGAFSYDQLLNTETTLITAEQNYVKATYDYLLAQLNYEVATGAL